MGYAELEQKLGPFYAEAVLGDGRRIRWKPGRGWSDEEINRLIRTKARGFRVSTEFTLDYGQAVAGLYEVAAVEKLDARFVLMRELPEAEPVLLVDTAGGNRRLTREEMGILLDCDPTELRLSWETSEEAEEED